MMIMMLYQIDAIKIGLDDGDLSSYLRNYFSSEHLVAHLPVMENAHLLLLLRYFAEPFLLNTLPMFYG